MREDDLTKWSLAADLLDEVLDLPEEERDSAVRKLGSTRGVEPELRALLDGLKRPSLLDETGHPLLEGLGAEPPGKNALTGQQFGGWLLGDEIGRGGMSVVYHAYRKGEGFEQHAAFKLLSIAFLGPRHIGSFLRERRILSELTHPAIARLIDGGVTPDGIPYLVMDYVDGVRIDRWCREHSPDKRSIVGLVEQVCRAAAHAHRHLVVHRDINPSNVLVNSAGRPVLVDFGIAKLLGDAATGRTMQAFTPDFAAPEQLRADGSITTATDVFGLGRLLGALVPETLRDGDLGVILHVATHDDPEQRYPTAKAMADDLLAWMQQRPVAARPDSLAYRTRKFARRNRTVLAVAGLAVAIAFAGIVGTWQQSRVTRIEAEKRQAVAEFVLGLFEQADPMQAGTSLRVTDLLETAAHQARLELSDDPEILGSLLTLIASGQTELTNYEEAGQLLDEVEVLLKDRQFSPSVRADYLLQRAKHVHELGRFVEAADLAGDAVIILERSQGVSDDFFLAAATRIAYLVDAERFGEARRLSDRLAGDPRLSQAGLDARTEVAHRHAVALEVSGALEQAFSAYQEALALQAEFQPGNPLGRAAILSDYAVGLYFGGRFEECETVNREILAIYEREFTAPHPRISSTLHNLAFALVGQERYEDAVVMLEKTYRMSVELHGADHIDSLLEQATLGSLLGKIGEYGQAESMLRANLDAMARVAPDMRVQRGAAHSYLGDILLQSGRLSESREQYHQAAEFFAELPVDNVRVVEVRERLAEIASKQQSAP